MSTNDVLSQVTAEHDALKRKREEAFGQLMRILAEGQEVKPAEAARTLDEAGRSVEDLRKAVALYQQRKQLRHRILTLPIPLCRRARHQLQNQINKNQKRIPKWKDLG